MRRVFRSGDFGYIPTWVHVVDAKERLTMKTRLAALFLPFVISLGASACTQYTAIANAPDAPNKVFVTKTTSYIVWTTNKMLLCDWNAHVAKNCAEVTEE
jgi:hypothetical protein